LASFPLNEHGMPGGKDKGCYNESVSIA